MERLPRYRSFNKYLIDRFRERVYRIPIDAGFTCPNRDGARAFGGCTFCDDRGSGAPTIEQAVNIKQQLESGIARIRKQFKANKFIAYFQAFTNTYAPEGFLRQLYDVGLDHPDVVGLSIGTRPDCLPDNVLDLLSEYDKRTFTWLEIGLQSASNKTLDLINRGHTAEEFFDAVERAQRRQLKVATHLIFGLPGEDEKQMLETVRLVAQTGIEGIKIHQLCIFKGTPMEKDYQDGRLKPLDEDVYLDLIMQAIELLPPDMVIMRLLGEGRKDELLAPTWSFDKARLMRKINQILEARDIRQGNKFRDVRRRAPASSVVSDLPPLTMNLPPLTTNGPI